MTPRAVPATREVKLGDYRMFPGSRIFPTCALCGWNRSYSAERIIDRLRELHGGGYDTPVGQVARRVAWTCPGCGRVRWRTDLAWPEGLSERDIKRLANQYRN